MKARGRPVLGAISGLVLGIGVGTNLTFYGVRVLDVWTILWFPLIGLLLGIAIGLAGPLGRRRA